MALWSESELGQEALPQETQIGEASPLRVLNAFHDTCVLHPPLHTPRESAEPFLYDHMTMLATFDPGGEKPLMSLVVREAVEAVERSHLEAHISYREEDRHHPFLRRKSAAEQSPPVPAKFGYFVGTSDGERTDVWDVEHTYWRRGAKCDEMEFVMHIMRPIAADRRYRTGGELRLSLGGGVMRLPGHKASAWLIGQGDFAHGVNFLSGPDIVSQGLY